MKTIKPGSRPPRRRWCEWLEAIVEWTPEQRSTAWDKAQRAWQSGSIQAQYAALAEMEVLDKILNGEFNHTSHCAAQH